LNRHYNLQPTIIMDFLKAEVEKKRKALDTQPDSAPAQKYVRRADLEREREAAYLAQQQERKAKAAAATRQPSQKLLEGATRVAAAEDASGKGLARPDGKEETAAARPEVFNIPNEEAVRRLRGKGQPIRLFAESDKERRLRLRALELIEERTEGQRNDFMMALETMDKGLDLEELARKANPPSKVKADGSGGPTSREGSTPVTGGEETEGQGQEEHQVVDLSLLKTDPKKLYPQIYWGIKVCVFFLLPPTMTEEGVTSAACPQGMGAVDG
jgi:pre-mRNA-splicing factor 18